MIEEAPKNPAAVALGRAGGLSTRKRYGRAHYVSLAKLSAQARRPLARALKKTAEFSYTFKEPETPANTEPASGCPT